MTCDDRLSQPRRQNDLLLYRLYRIHATAGPLVVRLADRAFGLTRREWRVLSCLAEAEGLASSQLAGRAMLDRARTSRTLTRLVDKGLVRRVPKPSDRREVHLFLTDAGRAVHAAMFPQVAAVQAALLDGLDAAQRRQLDELLTRLQDRADQLRGSGPLLPVDDDLSGPD